MLSSNKFIQSNLPNEGNNEEKIEENQIKGIPIRNVPAFKTRFDDVSPDSSKYFMPEIPLQKDNMISSPQTSRVSKIDFSFSNEIDSLSNRIPLPTNRKQRDELMVPYRRSNLPRELAQINQPEHLRTKWIFRFAWWSILLFIFITFNVFVYGDSLYLTPIVLSPLFFAIAIYAYKAQKRRQKLPIPPFPNYSKFSGLDFSDKADIDSPSAMFAKDPPSTQIDTIIDPSLNISLPYSISDRATADIYKDQNIKQINYDQLAAAALRDLGITPAAFNRYLTNFKSFIPKIILSKLIEKIHSNDSQIVAMLTVPGYERYNSYTISRIRTLASSHFLAGHLGDKGARWNDREWTSDYPSDNQIILHILDVWLSYFMSGKRKGTSQSLFTQKYVFIKKDPVVENEDDTIFLCSDDWSHFYVYTAFKEGKGLQRFYASSGRDAMYAGLTLFFWFIKEKKKSLIEAADLNDVPICMDKILSLSRFDL